MCFLFFPDTLPIPCEYKKNSINTHTKKEEWMGFIVLEIKYFYQFSLWSIPFSACWCDKERHFYKESVSWFSLHFFLQPWCCRAYFLHQLPKQSKKKTVHVTILLCNASLQNSKKHQETGNVAGKNPFPLRSKEGKKMSCSHFSGGRLTQLSHPWAEKITFPFSWHFSPSPNAGRLRPKSKWMSQNYQGLEGYLRQLRAGLSSPQDNEDQEPVWTY